MTQGCRRFKSSHTDCFEQKATIEIVVKCFQSAGRRLLLVGSTAQESNWRLINVIVTCLAISKTRNDLVGPGGQPQFKCADRAPSRPGWLHLHAEHPQYPATHSCIMVSFYIIISLTIFSSRHAKQRSHVNKTKAFLLLLEIIITTTQQPSCVVAFSLSLLLLWVDLTGKK